MKKGNKYKNNQNRYSNIWKNNKNTKFKKLHSKI